MICDISFYYTKFFMAYVGVLLIKNTTWIKLFKFRHFITYLKYHLCTRIVISMNKITDKINILKTCSEAFGVYSVDKQLINLRYIFCLQ